MEKFLNKKYKTHRVENLDEMLKELGFNALLRKLAPTMTTTIQLVKKDEETYSLNTTILLMTTSQTFKLGEEKDVKTTDGRRVKNVFTIQGNVLTEKQIGEKTFTITREYSDDELIVVSNIGDVTCTSWCKVVD